MSHIDVVKRIRKKQSKPVQTADSKTPLYRVINLMSKTRDNRSRKNVQSTTSDNTKYASFKKHNRSALRNSRSRQNLSPKNKIRLSTAKNTRELIGPKSRKYQDTSLSMLNHNLPQLPKVVRPKIKKQSITKTFQHPKVLAEAGRNHSTDMDLLHYQFDCGNMKSNQSRLKKQAKRYQYLAEGPMTMDKFGLNYKKPLAGHKSKHSKCSKAPRDHKSKKTKRELLPLTKKISKLGNMWSDNIKNDMKKSVQPTICHQSSFLSDSMEKIRRGKELAGMTDKPLNADLEITFDELMDYKLV